MSLRNPSTGKKAVKIRVWFTASGSSPDLPYFERKWFEERYVAIPDQKLDKSEG